MELEMPMHLRYYLTFEDVNIFFERSLIDLHCCLSSIKNLNVEGSSNL